MRDIELAKKIFEEEKWSLVIVKDGHVLHQAREPRLLPLFNALHLLGSKAGGSSVADRAIGRAAAMLLVTAGVDRVYTPLMSMGGHEILEEYGIIWEAENLVSKILDGAGRNPCPMEKLVAEIQDPFQGRRVLEEFFASKNLL